MLKPGCNFEKRTYYGGAVKLKKMDKEWVQTVLKRYESDRAVSHVKSVDVEPAVTAGDNFTSALERWKVKVILGSGKTRVKKFIVKNLPQSTVGRNYVASYFLVQKEIRMYEYVFSNVETIMLNYNDKKDKLWCEMIGYRPYDTIMLQDLTELNYVVPKRTDFLDLEHCLLAARGLARFHALSKVAVILNVIDKNIFGQYQLVYDPKSVEVFMEGGVYALYKGMKKSWGPEWGEVADRVKEACDSIEKKQLALANIDNDANNVLNHGDLWLCNLLFKYDDYRNKPISIKFIDFQLVHYNSFAWDLVCLMYTSITPEFRRKHSEEIYDAYYNTLIQTLNFYKYKGRVPTRACVNKEMDRLRFFGFVVLATMFALTISEVENPFNLEVFGENQDPKSGFDPKIYESEKFKLAVQQDLLLLMKDGII